MPEYEFSTYPPTVDEYDWWALLGHGLMKVGDYIVHEKSGEYLAVNCKTGMCDYGSEDDFGGAVGSDKQDVQQHAIDALEAGSGGVVILINNTLHASCTYEDDILILEYYQGQLKVYSNLGLHMPFPILTADPNTTGWGSAEEGRWWYNSTDSIFKYWDGSAIRALGTDPDAIHDNVANEISAITEKVTPVGADIVLIEDSAASYVKKKVQVSNLPGTMLDGIATITSGNTEVTVTHNKGVTNNPQITSKDFLGGREARIKNVTNNAFDIEIDSADFANDHVFTYHV